MAVLGVDFGNWYGYVSFVQGADQNNRGTGICQNLVQEGTNGIPTVIYHNCIPGREREAVGNEAVRNAATPLENRVRLLKHHLQEKYTLPKDLSGRYGPQHTFEYDEAIKKVLKYMVDKANELLVQNFPGEESANEIYLAYPGRFGPGEIQYFINLAQQVRLANGKNIVVKGTIAEPAAAALDYLSKEEKDVDKATVMTIDEGAGTLDVAMVTAYPGGRPLKSNPGQTVYYEIHDVDGDMNAGGARYDERMRNILHRKVKSMVPRGTELTFSERAHLDHSAEEIKISLTDNTITEFSVEVDGDFYDGEVTREEFEKECADLIDRLGTVAKSFYDRNRSHKPDCILLTGGAARMPMVIKKGTAIREKELMPLTICWQRLLSDLP
jgi:molecular chaperone DnaK (HSP70)